MMHMAESKQKESGEFSQTQYLHSFGGHHEKITKPTHHGLLACIGTGHPPVGPAVVAPWRKGPAAVHAGSIGKARHGVLVVDGSCVM